MNPVFFVSEVRETTKLPSPKLYQSLAGTDLRQWPTARVNRRFKSGLSVSGSECHPHKWRRHSFCKGVFSIYALGPIKELPQLCRAHCQRIYLSKPFIPNIRIQFSISNYQFSNNFQWINFRIETY